ncbi:MAG: Hsp20/alpha crystallin family protein [Cyanobacteria bacterium J06638_28]
MMVRYWSPFQEMETLRRQLDQVFDEVTNVADSAPTRWVPAMRLIEAGDTYVLTVQLPGVNAEDVDVQVTRETVEIKGDRKATENAEGTRTLYDNIRYGTFHRVVNLPEAVQNDSVTADFHQGLLTLTLPKVEEARNQVVKINLGQVNGTEQPAIATADGEPETAN